MRLLYEVDAAQERFGRKRRLYHGRAVDELALRAETVGGAAVGRRYALDGADEQSHGSNGAVHEALGLGSIGAEHQHGNGMSFASGHLQSVYRLADRQREVREHYARRSVLRDLCQSTFYLPTRNSMLELPM